MDRLQPVCDMAKTQRDLGRAGALTVCYGRAANVRVMSLPARSNDRSDRTADAPARAHAAARLRVESGFDFTNAEYASLYERSRATAFQHPVWLDAFYRHLPTARAAEGLVVTGRDDTGRMLFVLPMIRRRKSGVTLIETADLGVSDYSAPVVDRDWSAPPDLRAQVAAILPAHDLLRIRPVRAESCGDWQAFFAADSVPLGVSSHAVPVEAPMAAWRQTRLDASFARRLARKRKRFFAQEGARVERIQGADAIGRAVDEMRRLRSGRFEGDMIALPSVHRFYRDVAVKGAERGFAHVYALMLGQEAIGYVFGIADRGRFHYLLIGCDYEAHGRHSPGLLLYDAIIEDWAERGGTVFDFTIGDEPFKSDFGTAPTPMFMLAQAGSWFGGLAATMFDARERLRRLRGNR
jgi:CelD/BcsL family acetyltransferase involved in cellulose biosynthesis